MTTNKMKLYSGVALTKAIDKLVKSHKDFEAELHVVACSAIQHSIKHHNVDPIDRLCRELGGSVRRNALIAWACAFGECAPAEDGKGVVHVKREGDLAGAQAKPFWEFKAEAPFTAFDLGAELAKLVKAAEKAAKDERNSLPEEGFRKLRELSAAVPKKVA